MRKLILTAVALTAAALLGAAPVVGARGEGAEEGAVAIGRSHDGAVFSAAALAPGRPATGSIRVWNDGTVSARFMLSADVTGDERLVRALRLRITTAAGRVVYDGPLAGFRLARLGSFAPGEGVTVRFRASLPAERAEGLHGLSLSADFRWGATQA